MRLAGIAMIVLGALAVIYGGFSYTKDDTKAELGPITVKIEERERVNVPLWAGIATIVGGALLWAKASRSAA